MAADSIQEKRFVQLILSEEGKELIQAHKKAIARFTKPESGRLSTFMFMQVKAEGLGGELQITHLARQRFLDMKTRQTKAGLKRKRAFPIHNRILFGHLNQVIGRLKYGFTEEVKRTLQP